MSWLTDWRGLALMAIATAMIAVAAIQLPDPYPWIVAAAVLALIAAFTVPLPVLVFGWAAVLPIWSIGPLPTVLFDAARLGLGMIIGLRAWAEKNEPNKSLQSWALPLGVVATWLVVIAWWHGSDVGPGVTMLMSVVLTAWALWRLPSVWPLLLGFATGTAISAAVLIGTAMGVGPVEVLVPNVNPGVGRFTGLGTAAPRVSLELAVAAVVWWCALSGRIAGRILCLIGAGVTVLALLLSGGRTGLLGLAVAVALIVVRRWLRPGQALMLLGAVVVVGWWMSRRDVAFNTLARLGGNASGDGLGTGRVERLSDAWERFLDSPWLGLGTTSAHFTPLTFGLAGGVLAGVIITILSMRLALLSLAGLGTETSLAGRAGALIAAILTVTVALETTGPFLGVEMLALLFCAVLAADRRAHSRSAGRLVQRRRSTAGLLHV